MGVCINLEKPVERIIPLYGAFSEMLLALGAGSLLAGRTVADGEISELAHLPAVGTHMRPNAELVVALRPDVVLQMAGRREAALQTESLRRLGVQVLTFDIASFDRLFEVMEKLGALAGCPEKAAQITDSWKSRLAALKSQESARKPSVYYEVREPALLAAGRESMVNEIIRAAGGKNVVTLPKKLARYNEEALLVARPDICLVQKGPMNPEPRPLAARPNLKNLPCVQAGRNFIVDEKIFARPGPGSIQAAETLAEILRQAQ